MQWYKDYSSLYTVIILNLSPSSPPGGIKVLGRYETAAYTFLYQNKNGCNPFQIIMQKLHRYKVIQQTLINYYYKK